MAYFQCMSSSGGVGAAITVTYDSSFYNKTMTCSNGTKTYTKTTTSSGSTTFNVNEEGTWTITCNGVSRTVDVVLNYTTQMAITKTVTVYSAASDTVSFTDVTGAKTVTTNANGQGSVSITFIPNSTITFTSSIAKNPNNLSQAYSKTITMTDSVNSIYVMPDNVIYWWGYNPNSFTNTASGEATINLQGAWTKNTKDMSASPTTAGTGTPYYVLASKTTNSINLTNATKIHWINKGSTMAHNELALDSSWNWQSKRNATYLTLVAFKYDATRYMYELDLTTNGNVNFTSSIYRWYPSNTYLGNWPTGYSYAIWYE